MKYKYIILAVLFALFSCGGGTKGTGTLNDGNLGRFKGVVLNSSSIGLSNLNVTVLETGDSGTTNNDGEFDVSTSFDEINERMTVVIESDDVSLEVFIYDIPNNVELVEVSLQISESEFTQTTTVAVSGISFDGVPIGS